MVFFFFFNDTATTEIYTLSLHDALPILVGEGLYGNPNPHDDRKVLPRACGLSFCGCRDGQRNEYQDGGSCGTAQGKRDRKSTRLNSSHGYISYAVFCLKKKTNLSWTIYI